MLIINPLRSFLFVCLSTLTLALTGCAPVVTPPENEPLFNNQTDFHISELSHGVLVSQGINSAGTSPDGMWQVMREGFKLPEINSTAVTQQARRFTAGRNQMQLSLERASLYLYYVVQELKTRGMPTEIALLPFIESSYSPLQKGTLHHAGIWGIMPAAGKHLGLIQNTFKDERRDILRSTQGALDYLQELYGLYNDWQLAIVAYNWGPGNVSRAVAKAKAQKLPPTYANLSLPKAARDYLVWVAAYKDIIVHPSTYGLVLPPLSDYPYFVVIDVTRNIDISVVLELAEVSKEDFLKLNPSFNKPVILSTSEQKILLPYKNAENFQNNLREYSKPLTTWKQTGLVVPKGKKK